MIRPGTNSFSLVDMEEVPAVRNDGGRGRVSREREREEVKLIVTCR